jgi:hypothetical protein
LSIANCRLPIADWAFPFANCGSPMPTHLPIAIDFKSAIGNRKLAMTSAIGND